MKIIIDIPEARYKDIQRIASVQLENYHFKTAEQIIANGTPLPNGHGRLIDADRVVAEATEKMKYPANHQYMECVIAHMELAPTIIEADKEGSDAYNN